MKNNPRIITTIVFVLFVSFTSGLTEIKKHLYGKFPKNFKWGLSTSSYQIEGGWNLDGKGESIWDNFTHRNPSPILDKSSGDVACDSYHKYEEDVKLLKNIGAKVYRFSLSWSRILPNGTLEIINEAGIDYYNKLINLLLANGIEPVVTLYHWDLPQHLQDVTGGWPNENMIEHFNLYARLAFSKFGDRVKMWITFNEPWDTCMLGYGDGIFAPGISKMAELPYKCAHTIIKAHATAYRTYELRFKSKFGGRVGIVIDSEWFEPADKNNPADVQAAERALQFKYGYFASPIFFGKYPDVMRKYIDEKSEKERRNESRLPKFEENWSKFIKGTADFVGLNHYSTELVTAKHKPGLPGWYGDQELTLHQDSSWPKSASDWLRVVPWGFRKILNWIKNTYGNPELYVTENGFSDPVTADWQDDDRVSYFKQYTNNMFKAIIEDNCNVKGYMAWSLLDNFEWQSGYSERFGVHWVNYSDPARQRIAKKSATFLKTLFTNNGDLYI